MSVTNVNNHIIFMLQPVLKMSTERMSAFYKQFPFNQDAE